METDHLKIMAPKQHLVNIFTQLTTNCQMILYTVLEKRCLNVIWSCINSNNTIVKSVSSSAILYSYSYLCENYRFLSDKHDIWPTNCTKPLSICRKKFYDYIDKHVYSANEAMLIRDRHEKQICYLTQIDI